MNKKDMSDALSLSCVENYILAYFNNLVDIRQLYVESFVPLNKVIKDFINCNKKYENYDLARVQETAEKLGIIEHKATNKLSLKPNYLHLILVNKNFFENYKLVPWRADHYIAVEVDDDSNFNYYNNYPLSCGEFSKKRLEEIYDNKILQYYFSDTFNFSTYKELSNLQYNSIILQEIKDFELLEENAMQFRDAILVLKTIRKRVKEWLAFESTINRFVFDNEIQNFLQVFIKSYDDLFVKLELSMARKKVDIIFIREKINEIIEKEKELGKYVKMRRIINGDFKYD